MTSSFQGDGPYSAEVAKHKARRRVELERKDWSPSCPKFGNSFSFSKFYDWSCSTRTRSQALGINIKP
jgi:hypothetical protein